MAIGFGSRGAEVRMLQLQLKAVGFDPGDIDGIFGTRTLAALKGFQTDYETLEVTGELDPETSAALAQALVIRDGTSPDYEAGVAPVPCAPEIWSAFRELVELVTSTPIRYGPGRGLFDTDHWVITHGPGGLGKKTWRNRYGASYASFHCSSWTNFFLGWLLRFNEDYTHAGNIPSLFTLMEKSADVHPNPNAGPYRGYAEHCTELVSNGDTYARTHVPKCLDIRELFDRRHTLPTFLVCAQSTKGVTWKWWHHTVLFAIDHADDSRMYRIAADGWHDEQHGYSASPIKWLEIDEPALAAFGNVIYRVFGVNSADGTYGAGREMMPVTIES